MKFAWIVLATMLAGCAPVAEKGVVRREAPATQAAAVRSGFVDVRAIFILRHADIDVTKKATMGMAVPLTERGHERAKELAHALKDAGVTRVVTTEAVRTKETGAALAKELGIEQETVQRRGGIQRGMTLASESEVVMEYLSKSAKPGDVILLVHHSSTLPSILGKFGYTQEPTYGDATEFDRMYVVLPDRETGKYRVVRARYGGDWGAR